MRHADDCTIAASEPRLMNDFKAGLYKHGGVTLHWMLGIAVTRKRDGAAGTIHLSRPYKDAILHRFDFAKLRPLSMPMVVRVSGTHWGHNL